MRIGPLLIASAMLIALAGCVPSGSGSPTVAPSPSATPVFASDAEALAAAEKAYAAYLNVSAKISADGGVNPTLIDPLVTDAQAVREHATYAYYAQRALRTDGVPTFAAIRLEQVEYDKTGAAAISFYVCVDATDVRVIDAAGADATPPNRPDRAAFEVTLQSSAKSHARLLLAGSDTWPGSGVCT